MSSREVAILTGALIGNALGTPFQGYKAGHIQQLAGDRIDGYPPDGNLNPEKPDKNVMPGLHGIHGQYLLAGLSAAAKDDLGRDPGAMVGVFLSELAGEGEPDRVAWGALRNPGRPLRHALSRWQEQYPWEEADHYASEEKSEGIFPAINGLTTLCLPPAFDESVAVRLARLTHSKPAPIFSAWVIHRVGALLLEQENGKKIDGEEIARQALEGLAALEEEYCIENRKLWREIGWGQPLYHLSECLSPLPSLLREANDDLAARTIVKTAEQCAPDQKVSHPQHGFAPTALCWALYRALGPMVPSHALEDVINRGGETACLGAVVGGLMGARYGLELFPDDWRDGCLALETASGLFGSEEKEAFDQWVAREAEWTRAEEQLRAPAREALDKKRKAELEKDKLKPKKPKLNQGDLGFAPPPSMWLEPGEEEHPNVKRKLKAQRGKKRIGWKEERREQQREKDAPEE